MEQQQRTTPTVAKIDAAVRLLADPDPVVFEACRLQLVRWGESARFALSTASEGVDPRLRLRARGLLRSLDFGAWLEGVRDLRHAGATVLAGAGGEQRAIPALSESLDPPQPLDSALDLLRAAVYLSSAGREPSPAEDDIRRWLLAVAKDLRPRLEGRTASTGARILAQVLCSELGFDGNHGSYYERDNVLVDRVVAQRRGIPVTLSVLYLVVGRLAGLSMAGVGMPDHFLVRIHGVRPVLLDPFHGGRTVTKADCIRYLRTAGYENSAVDYLRDLSDREVLSHLVQNLLRVHTYVGDDEACTTYQEAIRILG